MIGNERDLEIAELFSFIDGKEIRTALDVGAHWTWNSYAQSVKDSIKVVDGIDIVPDPQTAAILDNYYVGNVVSAKLKPYDLVFSISSLEHAGISTYEEQDWGAERYRVFARMVRLARKYLYVTVPFGVDMIIHGQYANITKRDLAELRRIAGKGLEARFYFTDGPGLGFHEIPEKEAVDVTFDPAMGIPRCIMILTLDKLRLKK